MATAQVAAIYTCDICETKNDVEWKCVDCDEIMCLQCKSVHAKSKMSRDHTILNLLSDAAAPETKEMESETKCVFHPVETYQRFCKSCDCLVCIECVASDHHGHDFVKISEITERKRKHLSDFIDGFKTGTLKTLSEVLSKTKRDQKSYSSQIEDLVKEITRRADDLKTKIDQIKNDLITTLRKSEWETISSLRDLELPLLEEIMRLKTLIEIYEKKLLQSKGFSVVQMVKQCEAKLGEAQVTDFQLVTPTIPRFVSVETSKEDLRHIYGYLAGDDKAETKSCLDINQVPKTNPKILSSFNTPGDLRMIAIAKDGNIWLGSHEGECIVLVSPDGRTLKKIRTKSNPDGMEIMQSGEVIFTSYNRKAIQKVTNSDKVIDFITTTPSHPVGLLVTATNEILATLRGGDIPKVVRYSSTGQAIQTIQYNSDGSLLFKNPWFICQNVNGDIWVSEDDHVLVVDNNGKSKFKYTSPINMKLDKPFKLRGLVCNIYGQVLIADWNNCVLYLVNQNGEFQQFLLHNRDELKNPFAITKDGKDNLWITCGDTPWKVVCVQYLE